MPSNGSAKKSTAIAANTIATIGGRALPRLLTRVAATRTKGGRDDTPVRVVTY
jgi:hypothetical protein